MVLPPQVNKKKRGHKISYSLPGGEFFMAKKGQAFTTYTEELKRKVVRLEEGWSYRHLRERSVSRVMLRCRLGNESTKWEII